MSQIENHKIIEILKKLVGLVLSGIEVGIMIENSEIEHVAQTIHDLLGWTKASEELPAAYKNLEICYDGFDALLTKHENKYCFGYYNSSGNFMREIETRNLLIENTVLAWRYHIPYPQEDIKVKVVSLPEITPPQEG